MPRKSSAALAAVPVLPLARARLAPPKALTRPQAAVWRSVVDALPAEFFGVEQTGLLIQYCRHVFRCDELEALLATIKPEDGFARYDEIRTAIASESSKVMALARSLRISNQARLHREVAGNKAEQEQKASTARKPWEQITKR